jgi:glutamate-1-semialdehyde 2,1-aminomutase
VSTPLADILARERETFIQKRPRSRALATRAGKHYAHGVPMHWMRDWDTPFPLFVCDAVGATLTCVDGLRYVDLCLGDTGAMFGHSPPPVARAIARQAAHGLATMLPSDQAVDAAAALSEVFGLPWWQITLTATDANRAVLRHARAITGRRRVLVFNHCYHGTVDEALVVAAPEAPRARPRPGLIGSPFDVSDTLVVEFNDVAALAEALSRNDVACVLAEPVMTNAGMVLPQPGFLQALRAACTRFGSLLVIDETHTLSSARGGYARQTGIAADFLVCGKAVAGGVPCAVFGFTDSAAARMREFDRQRDAGHSGLGTTLSANPLSIVALLACVREVMTAAAYQHMDELAGELARQMTAAFTVHELPWHVSRVGGRLEFGRGAPPRNGSESLARADSELNSALHLYLLNRGFILTPFHNMMLVSPATTRTQVDGFMKVFEGCLQEFRSCMGLHE